MAKRVGRVPQLTSAMVKHWPPRSRLLFDSKLLRLEKFFRSRALAYFEYSLTRARPGLAKAAAFTMGLQFLVLASPSGLAADASTSTSACGMQLGSTPAFCETFDTAAGIGDRSDQLNGSIWGVAGWTGGMNFGSH